jgi:hypothetical protein
LLRYHLSMAADLHPLARIGHWLEAKVKPGQEVKLYRPKVSAFERKDRIAKAKMLAAQGTSLKEISTALGVDQKTVRTYLA